MEQKGKNDKERQREKGDKRKTIYELSILCEVYLRVMG